MALVLISIPLEAQTNISQPRFGYSLTLPDGWERIPLNEVEKVTRTLGAKASGQRYDDGFQRVAGGKWLRYPYVLVQAKEDGRVPEGQLRRMKSLRSGMQAGMESMGEKLGAMVSNMSLGDSYYDESNKCILVRLSMNVATVGEVRALTCGFLTEKGLLLFHCYAKADDYDSLLPTFQQMLNSVKINQELSYKPQMGDSIGVNFSRIGRSAVIGAVIGGLVDAVVWLSKRLGARKKPAGPPPLP